MWLLHRRALERGIAPVVPAGVVVEVWRGSARMAMLLAGCQVDDLDEVSARAASVLLGRCTRDVGAVDATVVEGALRRRDAVVTSNRSDIEALASGVRRKIAVVDV